MNKEELIKVWEDTEDYCDYNLTAETQSSCCRQEVFWQGISLPKDANTYMNTKIQVTPNDAITASYFAPGKVALLNFASGTNPGGGTFVGSSAQEECICRCTNLLPCLYDSRKAQSEFYDYHKFLNHNKYTDRCIYTPDVVIFRDKDYNKIKHKVINVISCAAPNLRDFPQNQYNKNASKKPLRLDKLEQYEVHYSRAENILKCAIINGCDSIILGAFGCGAFKNDPEMVAQAYKDVLQEYKCYFQYIEFAVFCRPNDTTNYDTFKRIMQGV